ncbi:MAG: STAS domain-containing protein, partial [Planctomycetota bacterium]
MATERACRVEQDGNLLIMTLLPELADVPWADVEEIGSSLETRVLDRDKPQLIVDLTPLAHMGSGMVALVVRLWKASQQQGGKFAVVNDHELVGEVLTLAGLSERWTIVSTREEARRHLDVRSKAVPARPTAVGDAIAEPGGGWLAIFGVLAVIVSAAALILMFVGSPDMIQAVALKVALFAGAVAGIVLGSLSLAWYLGVPRFTGVGVLICSIALLIAGLVLEPEPFPADVDPHNDSADLDPPAAEEPAPDADPAGSADDPAAG